jgi:diaminopimelate epimerase
VTELFRLSGAGNDFLALVEPDELPAPERIRAWCRRGVSLGADGVFALRHDDDGDGVVMDYWNADGGAADLCVNGTRCAAQLAFHLGWGERTVRVRTPAGALLARRISDHEIELEVPLPQLAPQPFAIAASALRLEGVALTVGVPHAVVEWPGDLGGCPIEDLGPPVRFHEGFPHGANANFVRWPSAYEMEIRTWERGVEAETLACGTGVLASVAAGVAAGRSILPVRALTRGGFIITVAGEVTDGVIGSWTIAGDARVLSCLETFGGAEHELPPPPQW